MPGWSAARRFTRYPVQLPLLYRIEGSSSPSVGAGWTHNLSEGGTCVEFAERLGSQAPLTVRLQTDRGPIELRAQVVWTGTQTRAGGGVLHGLAFTQVAPEQLQALRDLLLPLSMASHAGLRLPIEIPVTCQIRNPPGQTLQGRTENVSREGLLLHLPEALPLGTLLGLTLRVSKGPVGVEGVVVWLDPPERRTPGDAIRHGVRFTSLRWATALALGLLLADLS